MSRQKGSKNKPKEEPIVEEKSTHLREAEAMIKAVAPAPTKPQGHGVTVVEEFSPKPDMGKIVPPSEGESICECLHKKAVHYGPERDWCNTGGCQCQSFNKK
jgi:hypothetical protein